MPQRQLLSDDTTPREAGDMGGRDLQRAQQRRGVVGHGGHRERPLGQRRAPRPAVVESGEPVSVREPLELEVPGLGGIAQPGDEQDVGPLSPALDPQVEGCPPAPARPSLSPPPLTMP
jgi:hypothetical protein